MVPPALDGRKQEREAAAKSLLRSAGNDVWQVHLSKKATTGRIAARNARSLLGTPMVEWAVIPVESEYWSAVVRRDAATEGRFVYAVVTTGI